MKLDYRLMPKNMQKQTKVDLGTYVQYVPAHVPLRAQETAGLEVIRFVSGNDRLLQEVAQHSRSMTKTCAPVLPTFTPAPQSTLKAQTFSSDFFFFIPSPRERELARFDARRRAVGSNAEPYA